MTRELSLLFEAADLSATECPGCISMPSVYTKAKKEDKYMMNISGTINGGVRLVDVCTQLMAGPSTCYCSDHSIPRCLAHGTYTRFLNAACSGWIYGPNKYALSMCYHHVRCNVLKSLTCHRYAVNATHPDHGYSILHHGVYTVTN